MMETTGDNSIFGRFFGRFADEFYLLFRLIFAFLVALHGAQKAFLLWGFPAVSPLGVWVDVAGWIEFIAAFLIAFGILTRLGAGALVVTMIFAYFKVHASHGLWPHIYLMQGGSLPTAASYHPLVRHRRPDWRPRQPQVRLGALAVQEGNPLVRRIPAPTDTCPLPMSLFPLTF